MKPFAFFAARPSTAAAICADEFAVVKRDGGIADHEIEHIFLEDDPVINLDDYSAVFVSGSQYGFNDDVETMTHRQLTIERLALQIADEAIERDFPFLGFCYGHQAIGVAGGRALTTEYFEPLSIIDISVTDDGRSDPLYGSLPTSFPAVVGHSESIGDLPENTVVLASSATCPVEAVRTGNNVYGAQYHPEINEDSLDLRIDYYNGSKYFNPGEIDLIKAQAAGRDFSPGAALIRRFVERYRDRG